MTRKDFEILLRDGWQKDEGYVFISYSSEDWEKVYPCVLELRARGINVFIDIEFKENSSSSWLRNLEERLIQNDECKGIVAFVSTGYMGSYACLTELIANRTDMQRMEKGNPLPVFYIALDEALSTPQKMYQHIYNDAVKQKLRSVPATMEPEECTILENYLLNCHLERYPDRESIRYSLLKPIKNRFNVAAIMYKLIFSDSGMMPSIQLFDGAVECAELLMRNFVNDKNESIELPVLEELRLETCARRDRHPVEKGQLPESTKPKNQDDSEEPEQSEINRLKALAEQGDADAQYDLGRCYEKGAGVKRDVTEAVYWYRKSAEQGNEFAQYFLGVCYANGEGVEKDMPKAVYWYRKSAEKGNEFAQYAQYFLGLCYERGDGVEKDMSEAVYWYRKSAEKGNEFAQYDLGRCYQNGDGVERDMTEAVYWFRKSAEQGDAYAQSNLGRCYEKGTGVERDMTEAVYWYRKSAEQGNADGQNNLGWYYEYSAGVEKDMPEAVYWYRKSAEQGNAKAQNNLGRCYEQGKGVEKDLNQAVYWHRKSAEQGNRYAKISLDHLLKG